MPRKPADQTVNRQDILLAAASVFYEKGYHRAKMEDIAAAVQLTAGSLYHHFPGGKQEILLEVLNSSLERVSQQIEELLNPDIRADTEADNILSPSEKLRCAVELHIAGITDYVAIGAALVFEIRTMLDIPEVRSSYIASRDRFENLFRTIIKEGVEQGVFRQDIDIHLFVRMILGAHNWVGIWYRNTGKLTGKQIAHQMADWFLDALCAKPEPHEK